MRYRITSDSTVSMYHTDNGKENGIMKTIRRTVGMMKVTATVALLRVKRVTVRKRVWKSQKRYIMA